MSYSLKVKRFFIASALVLATSLSALASENVISSVIISKSKTNPDGYELNIDSTQQVQYKSHIDGNNNVYFDLKNSSLAPNMGTIYDDVEIDNVTVKQLDKNKVRIYVNGENARSTELVFVNSLFVPEKDTSKKIVINRPVSEYKSTTLHNDLEFVDDSQEWDDNSFNLYHLASIVLSELKDGIAGKVLILLSLFAILVIMIKSLSSKLAQEKEPLIGLNNAKYLNNDVQIGSIGATVKMPKAQAKDELPSLASRNETLRQAQVELTKAHQKYQQYIQNKYQGAKKPQAIDVDVLKKSLALNQYQKSTQNPYKNQEVLKMNVGLDSQTKLRSQIPQRPKMRNNTQFTSPYIKKTNNFIDVNAKKEMPKTNMRFLESVSQIYERSGRGDLAVELKNSITKAKQTI